MRRCPSCSTGRRLRRIASRRSGSRRSRASCVGRCPLLLTRRSARSETAFDELDARTPSGRCARRRRPGASAAHSRDVAPSRGPDAGAEGARFHRCASRAAAFDQNRNGQRPRGRNPPRQRRASPTDSPLGSAGPRHGAGRAPPVNGQGNRAGNTAGQRGGRPAGPATAARGQAAAGPQARTVAPVMPEFYQAVPDAHLLTT